MSEAIEGDEVVAVGDPVEPMLAFGGRVPARLLPHAVPADFALDAMGRIVDVARGPAVTQLLLTVGLGSEVSAWRSRGAGAHDREPPVAC